MADGPIFLNERGLSLEVRVQPVVLLTIIDHFTRRNENQKRVIGTLLGSVHDGIVEVSNCFALPHMDAAADVHLDLAHHKLMLRLHKRIAPREQVVGWYTTGDEITSHSVTVHTQFYSDLTASPILLTVDTAMRGGKLGVQAFTGAPLGTSDRPGGVVFAPVKCEVKMFEADRVGINLLQRTRAAPNRATPLLTELDTLEASIIKLQSHLATAVAHVEKVLAGKVPSDAELGRMLSDAASSVPKFEAAQFEKLFNSNLQDLLMVMYLSSLTRTQLSIADRLNSAVF
ncbi:hypothetical protein CAOG_04663 [Capsaspora owczarzaki ATCC 30864]|uniref:Eukaryotic translation initiation factor 3 subunit F n=1 Tax=Capsaspora owczarzaki (strain ATCC 30864) TaxID=595528 RepID=A0A0D2X3A2_CAPO3|nr:hypothetical protein CAOG_04663 [Capsaspora owczarzaki ATCC 30864]KJE93954.1 hypothetical protein CAOG_004663 [Capsaspora owczarzaki ATCC 30864]|eukprot:XP_004347410.1 hypothetical protein CAOG_04663 [Capsaspora owczarzaki ATCC 30864]